MAFDNPNFKPITEPNGRVTYININDIRSFYNYETKLIIEMIDGTVYEVQGAPAVGAFFAATFVLDPLEVQLTDNPLTIDGTLAISSIGGTVTTSTTITNVPLVTKEQLTELTFTSSAVSVGAADTLVLPANPNRKFLMIQRGTTIGRVFVNFGAGAATATNGMLFRENAYFALPKDGYNYTGEIRAISVGSSKILYVTEATS